METSLGHDQDRRKFLKRVAGFTALGSLVTVVAAVAAKRKQCHEAKLCENSDDPFCCMDSETQQNNRTGTAQ